MTDTIQVFMTTEREEDARRIGRELLRQRLVACVQIVGPVSSIYWWKDRIEETGEWLCLMKSKKGVFEQLERKIKELHPYEVPEIAAVEITEGSPDYLGWIDREVRPG